MGGDIAGSLGEDIGGGKKQQAPHFVVRVKEHSSHQYVRIPVGKLTGVLVY